SYFFFQAEDGIRDLTVTGVQTCALPIWSTIWVRRKPTLVSDALTARVLPFQSLSPFMSTPMKLRSGKRVARPTEYSPRPQASSTDRKSTRLNSSHSQISYAVFCLKKKI